MGSSTGGRDMDFGVATWEMSLWEGTRSRHRLVSRRSRHGTDVSTWPVGN